MTPAQRADWMSRMGDEKPPALRNSEVLVALVGVSLLAGAIGWAARGERPTRVERRTEVKREVAPCYLGELPTLAKIPEVICRASYGGDCGAAIRPGRVVIDGQKWTDYVRAAESAADACTRFWFECDGGSK